MAGSSARVTAPTLAAVRLGEQKLRLAVSVSISRDFERLSDYSGALGFLDSIRPTDELVAGAVIEVDHQVRQPIGVFAVAFEVGTYLSQPSGFSPVDQLIVRLAHRVVAGKIVSAFKSLHTSENQTAVTESSVISRFVRESKRNMVPQGLLQRYPGEEGRRWDRQFPEDVCHSFYRRLLAA